MIPVLYLISWRREPGIQDASEHDIIGQKTLELLDTFGVSYAVLSEENYKNEISNLATHMEKTKQPAAIILKKGLISKEEAVPIESNFELDKAKAIDIIIDASHGKSYFVTNNGFISREVFYHLNKKG